MKSLDYVKANIEDIEGDKLDHRFTKRLLDFLPVEEINYLGFKYTGTEKHIPKEWNEENILSQLKEDVAFGIEKATKHRGISSGLMYEVCKSWCIVLENGLENTDYGWYGDKMFIAIDKKYNFGLVSKDTFNKKFYSKW